MANYATLKAAINAVIKANGNKEITGTVLNETLTAMVNSLGANYQFAGVATPSTNPGTPDQNVFYLAGQAGTYTNFNSIVLPNGVSILKWNGSWSSETVVAGDGVFDISAYKATGGTLATFADLSAALDGGNNIPSALRKGGMMVKFIQGSAQSSEKKYLQFFCNADTFTTNVSAWEKVNLQEEVNQLGKVSGQLLDKRALFVNNGYVSLSGTIESNNSYRYTTPIAVKKGEIFNIHFEAQIFNVYVTTFALFADSSMQNIIELSKNNGNKIDNAFICAEDGYLVISMKYDFVLDYANTAYLFKSTLLNDSQLVDYNAHVFLSGKIARSFTHRKTLYGSAIRTDVRGYISRNGDINSISGWHTLVLLFNVESITGRYINIFKYLNVGASAIPACFYNSSTVFDNTTKIDVYETEYGYKQNGDCGYVIKIPATAKTFALLMYPQDKTRWNEYYGCRIISLIENETDNNYPEFLENNEIICWGDSLTVGAAGDIPYENRWTTVLASLAPKYIVTNAGVGGEKVQEIMARNGARPFTLSSKITLPSTTTQVSLGQSVTNFYGETVELLKQGSGAALDSVNPVYVNGVQCELSLSDGIYYLKRASSGDNSMDIETYEPFQTIAGKNKRNPYAAIFWMGTNNFTVGYVPPLDYFIPAYKQIIDYTGTKNFIIIGLEGDSYVDSGLYITYEEYFSQNYGSKFVNIREYFCKQGWKDAGITLSPSDEERVAAGKIPSVFTVDGTHLTAVAQGLLANLLYKRMEQLGYIN